MGQIAPFFLTDTQHYPGALRVGSKPVATAPPYAGGQICSVPLFHAQKALYLLTSAFFLVDAAGHVSSIYGLQRANLLANTLGSKLTKYFSAARALKTVFE